MKIFSTLFFTFLLSAQLFSQENITLDLLNCPPGIFRTYEDFITGKVEAADFHNSGVIVSGGNVATHDLVFKGPNGKIKVKPESIWGFKHDNGTLYRMGKFASKKGTFTIPFSVDYVSDHIGYKTSLLSVIRFD